jgi:hypothetical protein
MTDSRVPVHALHRPEITTRPHYRKQYAHDTTNRGKTELFWTRERKRKLLIRLPTIGNRNSTQFADRWHSLVDLGYYRQTVAWTFSPSVVVPVLNQTPCQEYMWGRRRTAPSTSNLGSRWKLVDLIAFRRWSIAHRVTGFLGVETLRFGNWICFRPQVKAGGNTSVGPVRRANLNHWTTHVKFAELFNY